MPDNKQKNSDTVDRTIEVTREVGNTVEKLEGLARESKEGIQAATDFVKSLKNIAIPDIHAKIAENMTFKLADKLAEDVQVRLGPTVQFAENFDPQNNLNNNFNNNTVDFTVYKKVEGLTGATRKRLVRMEKSLKSIGEGLNFDRNWDVAKWAANNAQEPSGRSAGQNRRMLLSAFGGDSQARDSMFNALQGIAGANREQMDDLVSSVQILRQANARPDGETVSGLQDFAALNGQSTENLSQAISEAINGDASRLKNSFGVLVDEIDEGAGKLALTFGGVTQVVERSADQMTSTLGGFGQKNAGAYEQRVLEISQNAALTEDEKVEAAVNLGRSISRSSDDLDEKAVEALVRRAARKNKADHSVLVSEPDDGVSQSLMPSSESLMSVDQSYAEADRRAADQSMAAWRGVSPSLMEYQDPIQGVPQARQASKVFAKTKKEFEKAAKRAGDRAYNRTYKNWMKGAPRDKESQAYKEKEKLAIEQAESERAAAKAKVEGRFNKGAEVFDAVGDRYGEKAAHRAALRYVQTGSAKKRRYKDPVWEKFQKQVEEQVKREYSVNNMHLSHKERVQGGKKAAQAVKAQYEALRESGQLNQDRVWQQYVMAGAGGVGATQGGGAVVPSNIVNFNINQNINFALNFQGTAPGDPKALGAAVGEQVTPVLSEQMKQVVQMLGWGY